MASSKRRRLRARPFPLGILLLLGGLAVAACGKKEESAPAPALDLAPVAWSSLAGWSQDDPTGALAAFRRSCATLGRKAPAEAFGRQPVFGTNADWLPACRAAENLTGDAAAIRAFVEATFVPLAASDRGEREGLFTGYYEPLLTGARAPDGRFRFPLHRRPGDLVQVDLGRFDADLEGRRIAGRVVEQRLVPYPTRAEIDAGALDGKDLELLWVDDEVAKFFLQIQGSGQVELPDGQRIRVGYADQNGQPYRAIGRDLLEMGALAKGAVSLQSIRAWLEQHPDQARAVMEKNRSYVFFREVPDAPGAEGPPGAQGVPLTPGRSLAVDRRFVPLGVPIWLETSVPAPDGPKPLARLVVAQDTGGAIRGPVRGDLFWGTGSEAEYGAGHMQSQGRYYILVPRALVPAS